MRLGNSKISFMFSSLMKTFSTPFTFSTSKSSPLANRWVRIALGGSLISIPIGLQYMVYSTRVKKVEEPQLEAPSKNQKFNEYLINKQNKYVPKTQYTFIQWWISLFQHVIRFAHLSLIFTPCLILWPLRFFQRTNQFWLDIFVSSIQRAGVVWIKAFQYMSHRRDIIGEQMAEKFVHLRENAPEHSLEETKENFRACYGKEINQIFDEFSEKPIASGSVSQVYKAKYHGKVVAVKVRHPGVDIYIQRDINLLFFFSNILSFFSKSFTIPVTEHSMKKTMHDQINFINEKENLLIFQQFFKQRNDITFPTPIEGHSTDSVLIQSFVNGVPITYYEVNDHPLKPVIARLGAETFFDMLIKHNFIHADAHGGNIMVTMKEKSQSFFGEIWEWVEEKIICMEDKVVASMIQSPLLKSIYLEGRQQAAHVRDILRRAKQKVIITVIDTGMVITLDERDRQNFIGFIHNAIEGNGQHCANMIYNLSAHDGKKLRPEEYPQYHKQLLEIFQVINKKDLQNLPGLELFSGMLATIRKHQMKLQGQFATLLTNMLVLEGMAKDIYPQINILKIAIPYFSKIQTPPTQEYSHYID